MATGAGKVTETGMVWVLGRNEGGSVNYIALLPFVVAQILDWTLTQKSRTTQICLHLVPPSWFTSARVLDLFFFHSMHSHRRHMSVSIYTLYPTTTTTLAPFLYQKSCQILIDLPLCSTSTDTMVTNIARQQSTLTPPSWQPTTDLSVNILNLNLRTWALVNISSKCAELA